ncbi:MAG: ABC1 kinase family protein [Rubricoccaceae bacterium]
MPDPAPPAPPAPARSTPVPALARPAPLRLRNLRVYLVAMRIVASYRWFDAVAFVRGPAWARRARPALHRRNGRRVRRAILRLRGLFVKIGQLASVLTGFLPEPFRAELEGLQDQVPAGPFAHVRARIEAELGAPLETLFRAFEATPLASASLAQVHRATLPDGRDVAVKVQHADIETVARLDLRSLRVILRAAGRVFGVRGLEAQFGEIERVVAEELDFRQEAANAAALAVPFAGRTDVAFPAVVPERSSGRVLTTVFEAGVKASDVAGLRALGLDPADVAQRLVAAYGQMIFRDGRYHADPHPGNLLVRPDGTLVFLDFGAVATLTPAMRQGLAEMLVGVLRRDAARVTAALGLMGFVAPPDAGAGEAARTAAVIGLVEGVHATILRDIDPARFRFADIGAPLAAQAQAEAFGQMRALDVSFRDLAGAFQVPRDWLLFERTALLLLGLCTTLAPDLNPLRLLWPYVATLVDDVSLDEALRAGRTALTDRVRETASATLGLPVLLDRTLRRVEAGETAVRVPALADAAARVYAGLRQLSYALGATGTGALAYQARLAGDGPFAVGFALAAGGFALAWAVAALRARRQG